MHTDTLIQPFTATASASPNQLKRQSPPRLLASFTRSLACLLFWLLECIFSLASANAGPNQNAKVLLHVRTPMTKAPCSSQNGMRPCADMKTEGELYPNAYFVYLVVAEGDQGVGIAGVECGIAYDSTATAGVDVYSWTLCASLQFSTDSWPSAGAGNRITWDVTTACQQAGPTGSESQAFAVAGYFYCAAYSTDYMEIVPHPVTGEVCVVDCAALNEVLVIDQGGQASSPLGRVTFSAGAITPGRNPCTGQVPSDNPDEWKLEEVYTLDSALPGIPNNVWRSPRWSPTKTEVALRGNDGLYIVFLPPTGGAGLPVHIGDPCWEFAWSADGSKIAYVPQKPFEPNRTDEVRVYDLVTEETKTVVSGPGVRYANLTWTDEGNLAVSDKSPYFGTLDFEVRTFSPAGSSGTVNISPDQPFVGVIEEQPGRYGCWSGVIGQLLERVEDLSPAWQVVASPSKAVVAVLTESDSAVRYVVSDLDGNISGSLPPTFVASDWTKNSRFLVCWESVEDPNVDGAVLNADLWIYDRLTESLTPLTETSSDHERDPAWSKLGRYICFVDEVTGSLRLCTLTLQGQ